ncbi:hypothetical protein ABFS82_03G053500 [Erythranthe guttata]
MDGFGGAGAPLLEKRRGGGEGFVKEFGAESKTLWKLSGPAIFTYICQYSLGALTQTFAGQVGELELAAVSVENSVIAGLVFGAMLGMGSALETLCGQAYGAGQITMLGTYMQRSWVILLSTSFFLLPIYIFAPPILTFFGESPEISRAAGKFAIWMIPQMFAYAVNFPIQKFLQSQRKLMEMAWISAGVLVVHTFFSWLLILKLRWGLAGAAVVLNSSWWLIVILQLVYIFYTKSDGAWTGFSWSAFRDLYGFVKLSLSSAIMLCLGVAVGAGWQSIVAYVNIGSYYIVGLPLGIVLGFVFNFGAMGIWGGMIGGVCLQTLILIFITSSRNWDKEADEAESRVRRWGGAIASH